MVRVGFRRVGPYANLETILPLPSQTPQWTNSDIIVFLLWRISYDLTQKNIHRPQ